ncbi:DUF4149 domain-containing protein [Marinivivus vitaminiproducens]|uniref:DUF4149 domain-containing protein n=1 Tax=Marinivivus vitaminiproducens TaxID=3035935 RepID=UPI0027A88955|nr:DUF4149 domain-containing protein [Geminicoccaceae bacterium SCSIO 64248]
MPYPARFAAAALGPLAWVWTGLVLGVSFFATPIKFQAASLARPVAFEVTGVTFAAFNRIEIAAAIVLLAAALLARRPLVIALCAAAAAIVAVQAAWLLPELLQRVELVQAGQELPPSPVHALYSGAEIVKVAALVVTGLAAR